MGTFQAVLPTNRTVHGRGAGQMGEGTTGRAPGLHILGCYLLAVISNRPNKPVIGELAKRATGASTAGAAGVEEQSIVRCKTLVERSSA
jgi:hypothetical protein